jgi:hypothetical protein
MQSSQQADKRITGTVTDQSGEPIVGASVFEKGTINGTTTNEDGNFSLNIPQGMTLQISYIGYVAQEFVVQNNTNLTIVLLEDTQVLDEVVVVGYGTQKRSNISGAVTTVKTDDMKNIPTTDFR